MRVCDQIKTLCVHMKERRGETPKYVLMNPGQYFMLRIEVGEWIAKKVSLEIEMFYGCIIIVSPTVKTVEVLANSWVEAKR